MGDLEDFRGLIELAIREEQKAQRLYQDLAAKAEDEYAKAILEGLREQEIQHETKLQSLLASIDPIKA
jgi:rubrerythrin